jgi:hypothetical protein
MRFPNRAFLFLLIFLTFGIPAFAEDHWRLVVPFQFEAKGQSFPAGDYDVAVDIEHGFVTLSNDQNASKRIEWLAMPADGRSQTASLKFGSDGVNFTLLTVNAGKWATPHRSDSSKYPITASIYDNDHKDLMASAHGQ